MATCKSTISATPSLLIYCSGYFTRDQMQAEFSEAAFGLQPGEMSGIVDTASGLHLIERCAHYFLKHPFKLFRLTLVCY